MDETAPGPEEAPAQPEVAQTFSLNLINIIRTAQGQNGVKHGDYSRYRRHCKNKLKALYKTLRFQHGRTKFIKRKIDVNTMTDARFLQIPIFNAERAWAYAKEFKKQIEGDVHLRKRRHLIARMVKAAAWGKELARLAAQRCDARGCVEAQAYAAFLAGSALAEREASWRKALALLTRSRHIFSQLARVGGSAEHQALYLQQVEEMEPTIRYCSYQLDRQGQATPNEAQLLADAEQEEGFLPPAQLSAHLASLAGGGVAAVEATATALEWQGQSIPVRQDRLKAAVQQVHQLEGQLSSCMEPAPGEGGQDPRVTLYEKIIRGLAEARTAARLAIKASTAPEGDPGRAELVAAEGALGGLSAQKQVELAELQVAESEARFALGLDKVSTVKGAKDRRDACRPEDVVRQLDGLSRALAELADVGARAGGRAGEMLYDQATAKSSLVRALRAYYTAHYLAKGGRALEAYALFGRAAEHAAAAKADQPAKADAARLAALVTAAATFQSVSQAEYAASLAQKREGVEAAVGGIALADAQQAQPTTAKWLLESLDSWEAFAGAKATRVYQLPYAMQAIPCRPIMLDTAASHLAYPSLEHRVRKEAKKGVLSSLGLGWAWGAKK